MLAIGAKDEKEAHAAIAEIYARPSVNGARVVMAFNPKSSLDLAALTVELLKHTQIVNDGDLARAEAMPITQAHALQAIFTRLSEMAMGTGYLPQFQTYMNLALKAQRQCTLTLEALNEYKHPRHPTFIRQQNVAVNQQVNNSQGAPTPTQKANRQNELLEAKPYERLDFGTAGAAGGNDPSLETVDRVHRTPDTGR